MAEAEAGNGSMEAKGQGHPLKEAELTDGRDEILKPHITH